MEEKDMTDRNGKQLMTGMTVKITGAYFKKDNGTYFITDAAGDVTWEGRELALMKVSKAGKISRTRYNLGFWPLCSFINDRIKAKEARAHNEEFAAIEAVEVKSNAEIVAYFKDLAEKEEKKIERDSRLFGEESEEVYREREYLAHYRNVIQRIERG